MNKNIVTSYKNPDLDGISCMYAYSEFLNKKNICSDYYIIGIPRKEVEIVCEMFNIKLNGLKQWEKNCKVILVDLNNVKRLDFILPEDVTEIIDHHVKTEDCAKCVNAKVQIELIGAAATLVAEKFKNENVEISRESAILLYYGIISNSINLKSKVTSKKDIEITEWLKSKCKEISEEKIEEIFTEKSNIDTSNLRKEIEAEYVVEYKNKKITLGQLEIVNVKEFLKENESRLKEILNEIKKEKGIDYIFINCVDILKGENIILTIDKETENFLYDEFGFEFEDGKSCLKKFVQRKEIMNELRMRNEVY